MKLRLIALAMALAPMALVGCKKEEKPAAAPAAAPAAEVKAEAPKAEAPKAEAPKAEAPKAEEAKVLTDAEAKAEFIAVQSAILDILTKAENKDGVIAGFKAYYANTAEIEKNTAALEAYLGTPGAIDKLAADPQVLELMVKNATVFGPRLAELGIPDTDLAPGTELGDLLKKVEPGPNGMALLAKLAPLVQAEIEKAAAAAEGEAAEGEAAEGEAAEGEAAEGEAAAEEGEAEAE